jgi:alkylhydroperoxidase family enzyme
LVNTGMVKIAGLLVGGDPPNVFTTMARHRVLFRRWMRFAGKLMPGGRLPRTDAELVILRVAHKTDSEYEWVQHQAMGKMAGLSEEEIARVKAGAEAPGWSPRQAMILAAVDQLCDTNRIDDELWERLAREFDEVDLIELCLLTGHYAMLAMTLNSLRVQPDPISDPSALLRWLTKR